MNTVFAPFFKSFSHVSRAAVSLLFSVLLATNLTGCHNAELWDELPAEISSFVNQYFPNSELESVEHSVGSGYHVRIKNGPGMSFDTAMAWTSVNGYGLPLPQVLLFNQLPPRMYEYLQETDQLNAVFSITRQDDVYTATLLQTTLTYDVRTGELSGTVPD